MEEVGFDVRIHPHGSSGPEDLWVIQVRGFWFDVVSPLAPFLVQDLCGPQRSAVDPSVKDSTYHIRDRVLGSSGKAAHYYIASSLAYGTLISDLEDKLK